MVKNADASVRKRLSTLCLHLTVFWFIIRTPGQPPYYSPIEATIRWRRTESSARWAFVDDKNAFHQGRWSWLFERMARWAGTQWRGFKRKASKYTPSSSPGSVKKGSARNEVHGRPHTT